MIGAIAGDILGSYYEFEGIKDYNLPLLPPESRFTDDTVMTIAVARWQTEYHDKGLTKDQLIKIMLELGREYWDAGYGSSFNSWLWCENPQPYNSWGNGAAMRVSPVGLYADSLEEALALARRTAEVSHNHPAGIAGAQAVAASVWLAKNGYSKTDIKDYIMCRFNYDLTRTIAEIRPNYNWVVSCQGSVPESIIAFLEGKDFEDVIRLVLSLGGDTDTMCCIAGAIAACVYNIPKWIVNECNKILSPKLQEYLTAFEVFIMKKTITGSLKDPKPIYSKFKNVYTKQVYNLISIFERKKDLSGLDGNRFIYALKGETGSSNKNDKNFWTFKSDLDILKIFRHFVYITKELNQHFDTLLVVPSSNKLNNIVMGYILRIIKQKNPNAILINDFLHKLDKGDVLNNIDFDSIESEWIQNDIIDIFENKMDNNFRYHLLPDEYRKYVTKTLYHENTLKYLPYFSDDKKILVFDDTISQGRTISETCKILIETCKVKPQNIVILTLWNS